MSSPLPLLELVRDGLLRDPRVTGRPLPAREDVEEEVRLNQMAPLFFLGLRDREQPAGGEWAGVQDAYFLATVQHAKRLRTGLALAEDLEAAGIPAICYRGPFSGLRLYGDLATRPFQDIDLIVPEEQADAAYDVAVQSGFHSQQEGVPPGFFRRHHIHWALHRDGTLLDLHWRVEHPYTLYRIDYDEIFAQSRRVTHQGYTWREPSPAHLLLLCCSQLTKTEPAALRLAQDPSAARHLFRQRLLWKWMDIALLWTRHQDEIDPGTLLETARRWRMESSLAAALAGLETLFAIDVPTSLSAPLQAGKAWPLQSPAYAAEFDGPGWLSRFALKRGGFRFNRINDIASYLFPPADYFPARGALGPWCRLKHLVCGLGRIAFVLADVLWTLALRPALLSLFKKKAHRVKSVPLEST